MKRREILGATLAAVGAVAFHSEKSFASKSAIVSSSNNSLQVEWLGQTCFLFTANGVKILVNPFRTIGCTLGYVKPKIEADLVLISSYLWDEGAVEDLPGNPKILYDSGDYTINGLKIQGISVAHDLEKGRQFGNNIAWQWKQGGIKILHLGGAAAPLGIEEKILMGSPDLALIPVGGGPKAYNPTQAKQALDVLKSKVMIPTQYLTQAADKSSCDLVDVDQFLQLVNGYNISRLPTNKITISPKDLPPKGTLIRVLNSDTLLAKNQKISDKVTPVNAPAKEPESKKNEKKKAIP